MFLRLNGSQSKKWVGTINNYSLGTLENLEAYCKEDGGQYTIAEEVGESGTPHLQFAVVFKTKKRFTTLKKVFPNAHWEKMRGTPMQAFEYCRKDSTDPKHIRSNVKFPRKIVFPKTIGQRLWQRFIIEKIIETQPDDRSIYWFYESRGGIGKSVFCKYIHQMHDAIFVPPKRDDAFHAIAKKIEAKEPIDLVVYDIPRCIKEEFISYSAIEKVKDGLFSSGKYEGCMCCYACPHVIVFSNHPPDTSKLSADRWHVYELTDVAKVIGRDFKLMKKE